LLVAVVVDCHGVHNLELAEVAVAADSDLDLVCQFLMLLHTLLPLVLVEQVVDLTKAAAEEQTDLHLHFQPLHLLAVVLVVVIAPVLLMVDLVAVVVAVVLGEMETLHQYHHLKVIVVDLVTLRSPLLVETPVLVVVVALVVLVTTVTPTSVVPVVQEQRLPSQVFR